MDYLHPYKSAWKLLEQIRNHLLKKKIFDPRRIGFVHQHSSRLIVLEHQYAWLLWRNVKTLYLKMQHLQAMGKSSLIIIFRPECKARNIQILVSVIKAHQALLIFQTILKDERCCSFRGEPLMLDWCLQCVLQIQQGFQIKWYGMIFITRPTYLRVLMGK